MNQEYLKNRLNFLNQKYGDIDEVQFMIGGKKKNSIFLLIF